MHLSELLEQRWEICAGLLVCVTERCPLSCAHCSASATPSGRTLDRGDLLRFLGTLEAGGPPDVVMFTGGEPLLRPGLVLDAAGAARRSGARTAVLSGAFFAVGRQGAMPPAIERVARAVDHFSVSLDAFHEREVPRRDVFALLDSLVRMGTATSLHVLATGPDDRYPDEVSAQVRRRFGDAVPMLVNEVRAIGRGTRLAGRTEAGAVHPGIPAPCAMAAWPVVAPDGAVVACCEQDAVDGRSRPEHLCVGDLAASSWLDVRERMTTSPTLRALRTTGPVFLAERAGCVPNGYCATCHRIEDSQEKREWVERVGRGPAGELLQKAAISLGAASGAAALVRRYGSSRHADLVDLGRSR
jgi:hypothetical protein